MLDIKIEKTTHPKPKPADESKLGFGKIFTDHMFIAKYKDGAGWYDASIVPYGPIELDPSLMSLHYGQSIFEGLKAYRGVDDEIRLFRPEKNFARLNYSAERMCLPQIDEDFALKALKALVDLDQEWIPHAEGTSLYLRPFMFGTDQYVGVHPSSEVYFMIICSPVGAYYPTGLDPVKIIVEDKYVRAVKGGTGYIKTAANYAQSLKAQQEAEEKNYSQVLWLDGIEHKYIEEVGTMNIFFVFEDEIVTPALNGSILSGITRMSCVDMLKEWGLPVVERQISIDEVIEGSQNGRLKECFGSGTAAVISPVGELMIGENKLIFNDGKIGELSQRLYDELTGIQWGKVEDKLGWMIKI
ncbi:branched-chain amino acid aminotransferase [Scatolibacter rhodanostii]|uniref:branched-chain amino acid aminotransferase n=1 Tax=Scatolibacter rhodanostii TaxID=2014781 RepID=UPI00190EE91B|nr:branched-chain amino acid aminotransferase [Scatolibacter rhodanostii]